MENFEEEISTMELTNDDNDGNELTIEVVNMKEEHINEEDEDDDEKSTDNSNKTDINSSFE